MLKKFDWAGSLTIMVVLVLACGTLSIYYMHFGDTPRSNDVNDWGVFGDYVGGIINPIVSFAALMFLYRAYMLQSRELAETREALKQTSDEAQLQTKESVKQTDISIYTALINAKTAELQIKNAQLDLINNEIRHLATVNDPSFTFSGQRIGVGNVEEAIKKLIESREKPESEIAKIRERLDMYDEFLTAKFNTIQGKGTAALPAFTSGAAGTVTHPKKT